MEHLQEISVPEFFDQYKYVKKDRGCVDLILLEPISVSLCSAIHDLNPDEIKALEAQCMKALDQIHSYGVVHNDIATHNMF